MYQIGEILKTQRKAPHDLAGIVNLIEKEIGLTKKYTYKYWLGKIKQSKKPLHEVYLLVEEALKLDKKYSRGGWLTNQLNKK